MKLNIALSSICVVVAGNYYATITEAKIDFQANIRRLRLLKEKEAEIKDLKKNWNFLLKVKDGTYLDGIESLDPTVTYDGTKELGEDFQINYGVEATLHQGASESRSVYATGSTTQAGWGLSTRADLDLMDRSSVDLEFDVEHEGTDVSLCVDARVSKDTTTDGSGSPSFDVKKVEGSYSRDTNWFDHAGTVAFTPRYDFSADTKDVLLQYESGQTKAEVKVSQEEKELKISRQFQDKHTIGLVLSDQGLQKHTAIDYVRDLENDGSLTINYKDELAAVNYSDGSGWVAKASAEVDKTGIHNTNVRIGTKLDF